jgi:hypothetical protein
MTFHFCLHPGYCNIYAFGSAAGSVDSALGASVLDSVAAGASVEGSASEEVQRV